MFSFFSKLKIKYQLILICFLPFLIQMVFIARLLTDDFNQIRELNHDDLRLKILATGGTLLDNLDEERNFSLSYQMNHESANLSELKKLQESTDTRFAKATEAITNYENAIDDPQLQQHLNAILASIDKIKSTRSLNGASTEVLANYDHAIKNMTTFLESFTEKFHNPTLQRIYYAYLVLYFQRNAIREESQIVKTASNSENAQNVALGKLSKTQGLQEAYQNAFREIATASEEDRYEKAVGNQSGANIEQLLNYTSTKSGTKDKPAPDDVRSWQQKQQEKLSSLSTLGNELLQSGMTYAQNLRSSKIHELATIIILDVIAILIVIYLVNLSMRAVVKRLKKEMLILGQSGEEIMKSITEASSGTEETATSVTETTTTVEELKQTAQVANDKAKNVADVSNNAISVLHDGEKTLEETIAGMHRIKESMTTISDSIVKLSEHGQSIGEIIDTVNELAEQSHILAVNAAIEAAKAGDQGKGFSVVAQEVRSLAEQSKQATVQVKAILSDIQNSTSAAVMATEQGTKSVQNGVEKSEKFSNAIRNLSDGISLVVNASAQISLSSEQQLIGVNQVNIAMSNIKQAAEQHVMHIRQIEQAMKDMNDVGTNINEMITKF